MNKYSTVDIKEDDILNESPDLLMLLLKDNNKSMSNNGNPIEYHSIIWATDDYAHLGDGYSFNDEITSDLITGNKCGRVIQPRISKIQSQQLARSKEMAEVFTPPWMCNEQNNLVDDAWFGRRNVFNVPADKSSSLPWKATEGPITDFPDGKTWADYVKANRMEISCGEAPYITSRYDTTTGEFIPLKQRIGILDRKLRLVSENCHDISTWMRYAYFAYKSIYAYEWQGDNLLLARESLFATFNEAFEDKFKEEPSLSYQKNIAYIISWNLWQMDGLRCVVPCSCHHGETAPATDLHGQKQETIICKGCKDGTFNRHIGTQCYIIDWQHKNRQRILFSSLLKCK